MPAYDTDMRLAFTTNEWLLLEEQAERELKQSPEEWARVVLLEVAGGKHTGDRMEMLARNFARLQSEVNSLVQALIATLTPDEIEKLKRSKLPGASIISAATGSGSTAGSSGGPGPDRGAPSTNTPMIPVKTEEKTHRLRLRV